MLLEMFPLIYYNYYFGFVFDLYKYYIFCIKVKKNIVMSPLSVKQTLLQGNTENLIPIDGLSVFNTVHIPLMHSKVGVVVMCSSE